EPGRDDRLDRVRLSAVKGVQASAGEHVWKLPLRRLQIRPTQLRARGNRLVEVLVTHDPAEIVAVIELHARARLRAARREELGEGGPHRAASGTAPLTAAVADTRRSGPPTLPGTTRRSVPPGRRHRATPGRIGPTTRAAWAPSPTRAMTAAVIPPFPTTVPAPTRRATSANAAAMRCWLRGSVRRASRSRSVAPTASPPPRIRRRAPLATRSTSVPESGAARAATRAATIAPGYARSTRASWAVAPGTKEPHTTSTPPAPTGG